MFLKDISLDIKSGEVIGILGGTGSGKSSLVSSFLVFMMWRQVKLRLLITMLRIMIWIACVSKLPCSSNQCPFSGTIKENMRWGNKQATDEEIIEACKIAQADEFIQEFKDGYNTKIERGGANVSGGQRQRLCIARASS